MTKATTSTQIQLIILLPLLASFLGKSHLFLFVNVIFMEPSSFLSNRAFKEKYRTIRHLETHILLCLVNVGL